MPAEPTSLSGPVVGERTVTFRLDDPEHRLRGVRLYQEVRIPGGLLDFVHVDGSWVLEVDRPEVDRMEYLFQVTRADGAEVWSTDPGNPRTVGGAFGDKSVLEMPGYRPPRWLDLPAPAGRRRELDIAARALDADVPVTL